MKKFIFLLLILVIQNSYAAQADQEKQEESSKLFCASEIAYGFTLAEISIQDITYEERKLLITYLTHQSLSLQAAKYAVNATLIQKTEFKKQFDLARAECIKIFAVPNPRIKKLVENVMFHCMGTDYPIKTMNNYIAILS